MKPMEASDKGKLYIVSTPIGNLEDITIRALKILQEVDLIIAEDPRHTMKLLSQFQIKKELLSYRDQNHEKIIDKLMNHILQGRSIALVSDAGTPLISDPGYKLVRDLISSDIEVISIPGPSAVTASLTISGLPTDKFVFIGFLPKGEGKREKVLGEYLALASTLILYESPYRLHKLLSQLAVLYPERSIAVVKDVTKLYEKVYRGSAKELLATLPKRDSIKGEYTVIIGKE